MGFWIKKICSTILTLLVVSLVTFLIFSVIPGDAATSSLGTDATPEMLAQLRKEMGLDQPLPIRYVNWVAGLIKGNLGTSYHYHVPVTQLIGNKAVVSGILGLLAFVLILGGGIFFGVLAYGWGGKNGIGVLDVVNQTIMAIPSFVMGIFLILIFGLVFRWFTPGSYVSLEESPQRFLGYLLLPALAIALPKMSMVVKLLKDGITSEMDEDYVRTARGKGRSDRSILFVHVLKNAMMPVVTLLGMIVAEILAGSLVVEQVFGIPGLGSLLISSIGSRDYPVVQAIVLYIALLVILMNFIVDLLYRVIDPRSRRTP